MLEQLDPGQPIELHRDVIQIRAAVANEINHLDADPPEDNREFTAKKIWLMAKWRDLSILRVQIAYAGDLD